jgi:hypothetical protein
MVRKLAVNAILLRILMPRNNATLRDGNSNVSSPVKCKMGRGIHIKHSVNKPIPLVQALEKTIERYGPIGDFAHARAL